MGTFGKTIKKRIDDEVFELYRNGIMHGVVVNFDNEVVATKAWNMLFAVGDWATATTKAAEPQEPTPTFREAFASIKRNAEARRRDEEHVRQTIERSDERFAADEAVLQATRFLEAWERGQWGIVTEYMPPVLRERRSNGRAISETKSWFGWHEITSWSLTSVTYVLPGAADIYGTATVNGEQREMQFRMVHLAPDPGQSTVRGLRRSLARRRLGAAALLRANSRRRHVSEPIVEFIANDEGALALGLGVIRPSSVEADRCATGAKSQGETAHNALARAFARPHR